MYKRIFRNLFQSVLTFICILAFCIPAWAESGPGSDIGVTIVNTGKTKAAETSAADSGDTQKDGAASKVITCGTGEAAASAPVKEQPVARSESGKKGASLGMFTTTGYCNCSECSGGHNLTYSGTVPKARHTISADLSVFPIGTKLMINDVVYTVEDMGSSVQGNCIDIYYDNHDAAVAHGKKSEEVFAVES